MLRAVQPQQQEEDLSEVDARVLRSLLEDSKLDLDTEEDVRRLLERGTVKSVPPPPPEPETPTSDFSSNALKTLTKTSRMLDEILNRVPFRQAAFVGSSAFGLLIFQVTFWSVCISMSDFLRLCFFNIWSTFWRSWWFSSA